MRRMVMILLSIIIFSGAVTSFAGDCGDVDNSGGINILDIVYLINYKYKEGPPPNCGTVTDFDGNVYQTVTIGEQVWMAENLKATHYRNGDPIPNVADFSEWVWLTTGAYCEYISVATYGRLYNWYAVDDSRGLAPEGWHVPTDAEWQTLVDYLGGGSVAGGKMKETGTTHWNSPNTGATNESGFSALPGGFRGGGIFTGIGDNALFWSSSEANSSDAWYRYLNSFSSEIDRNDTGKPSGFSVRCVKD